jgi:hypothetical protein
MSSFEPRDDQFPELPDDGPEGDYEFPFVIPDDGAFDAIADSMGKRGFGNLSLKAGFLSYPIAKARAKAVHRELASPCGLERLRPDCVQYDALLRWALQEDQEGRSAEAGALPVRSVRRVS